MFQKSMLMEIQFQNQNRKEWSKEFIQFSLHRWWSRVRILLSENFFEIFIEYLKELKKKKEAEEKAKKVNSIF